MENKKKSSSRGFFIFYCIILFLFAAILIGFSYLSQSRVEQEKTELTEGFTSKLELANAKIEEFEKTIVEQKKTNDELAKQVEALNNEQKKAQANEYLWKLVKAYSNKKYGDCRSIIALIDEGELRTVLSEEGLKELERIEKYTKGA